MLTVSIPSDSVLMTRCITVLHNLLFLQLCCYQKKRDRPVRDRVCDYPLALYCTRSVGLGSVLYVNPGL